MTFTTSMLQVLATSVAGWPFFVRLPILLILLGVWALTLVAVAVQSLRARVRRQRIQSRSRVLIENTRQLLGKGPEVGAARARKNVQGQEDFDLMLEGLRLRKMGRRYDDLTEG